ncbi:MAG: hypothetical protein V1899_09570 [Planctomycetota bacterium]
MQEMSYSETAIVLGIPESTVATNIRYNHHSSRLGRLGGVRQTCEPGRSQSDYAW